MIHNSFMKHSVYYDYKVNLLYRKVNTSKKTILNQFLMVDYNDKFFYSNKKTFFSLKLQNNNFVAKKCSQKY